MDGVFEPEIGDTAGDADKQTGVVFHTATELDAAAIAQVQVQMRRRILRSFGCRFLVLRRQIPAVGREKCEIWYDFWGGNRIGEGMWSEVELTCAVEFPILFNIPNGLDITCSYEASSDFSTRVPIR